MVAGAQVSTLGNADVGADPDAKESVQPDAFADPAMVADLQQPGRLDIDAGLEQDAVPDPRAEQTQQPDFQARRWIERVLQKQGIDTVPNGARDKSASLVMPRGIFIAGQIDCVHGCWGFPYLRQARGVGFARRL